MGKAGHRGFPDMAPFREALGAPPYPGNTILELRKDPNLGNTLFDRKDAVYGRGLPGYNVKGKDVPDALYFTIGPDKQLDAWEAYLRNAEGAETKLFRLYPRDFWMP